VEFIVIITLFAIIFLGWIISNLIKARRFNQFKAQLEKEIKPQVIEKITHDLMTNRTEQYPNNDSHINASIYYWTQYSIRILQAALYYHIIDEQWLKKTGNWRNSQHLFFIEDKYKQNEFNSTQEETNQESCT
jgi:hypothetical protein